MAVLTIRNLPIPHNLYPVASADEPAETFFPLLSGARFRLEHIVSHGQPTAPGEWYDQDQLEWVALLRGSATLRMDPGGPLALVGGDCVLIPAHLRHRVDQCSEDAIWLALFVDEALDAGQGLG